MKASRWISTFVQQRVARLWVGAGVIAAGVVLAGCAATTTTEHTTKVLGTAVDADMQRLAQTRLQLAALHLEHGRPQVALGEVELALQASPRYVDAFNLQGWIYLSLKDYQSAQTSFAQALRLRPGDADSLYNLAWVQCQQQQFAQADQNFDAALSAQRSQASSVSRLWLAKGVCLRQAGKVDAALQALEKAYEFDPGSPAVAYNFAQALYQQGNHKSAQSHIQRVNNGQWASAASLWLGIQIERGLGNRTAMRQLADQLHKRFPESQEWQRFEREAFDD